MVAKFKRCALFLTACLLFASPFVFGQTPEDSLAVGKSRLNVTGGQIILPFKIRPGVADSQYFRLTTDVTLGGFIGITYRLKGAKNRYLTFPLTAGLSFINIKSTGQSLEVEYEETEVAPGLSWSTGLIVQLEQYSLGLLLGQDYLSDIGRRWDYQGRLWWSFGIGYAFLQ